MAKKQKLPAVVVSERKIRKLMTGSKKKLTKNERLNRIKSETKLKRTMQNAAKKRSKK